MDSMSIRTDIESVLSNLRELSDLLIDDEGNYSRDSYTDKRIRGIISNIDNTLSLISYSI